MGGGHPQFQVYGGSCRFEDCEIAHNFDDLTNIGSEVAFAWNQVKWTPSILLANDILSKILKKKFFCFG